MSTYPILVDRYDAGRPSDRAICTKCHAEFTWDVASGDPDDMYSKHGNATVGECGGQISMKFVEGDRCQGCGKLDYEMPKALKGCCSRRCMLQAEYAKTLKAAS